MHEVKKTALISISKNRKKNSQFSLSFVIKNHKETPKTTLEYKIQLKFNKEITIKL